MARPLEPLPVPAGDAVLDLLPLLRRALSGDGPALLPVLAADPGAASRTARALAAGSPLIDGEDDDADPTAFVVTTSGSTGTPKGVLLPAAALMASARATRHFLTGDDPRPAHWLLALPAHHVAGLQVLLRSLVERTGPTVLDTSLPFTADRFADAAGRMPAGARFVSLVPTQLQRILADDGSAAALAGFDAALIGGAPASPALLDRATAAGVRAVTTYGMSETCGGCVYDGRPLDGVTVSTDEVGRISLAGPVVGRGYRGLPGHPAFDLDPAGRRRFRTDDVGDFVTDHIGDRWRVLGRADDVLITGGVKVAPAGVEATLAHLPGVSDVVLTAVPDDEWGLLLVAVIATAGTPDPAALRAAARTAHGPAAAPRTIVLVDELPLRGPGKPDRVAIRDLASRTLAAQPGQTVIDTRSAVP
ncbi:MAG TPA: o-succinylbenzoate--CoA ligase [Nakamurella sp.]